MVQPAAYVLYAVEINSGGVVFQRPLDQQGLDARSAGQRGALALQQGQVYVPFGGRFGDCGNYRGQVVAASANDPNAPLITYTTPAPRTGMWQAGGLPIGADSTIFTVTGNGDADSPAGRTEAVLALSPTLNELDSWQAGDWRSLDDSDRDIGSVAPALLQDVGLIFQSGKNGKGYLLRTGALGGVGGEVMSASLPGGCGAVFGGTAYAPPLLYIPCGKSLVALTISGDPQPGFSLAWRGPDEVGQPTVGSPIVVAGAVWNVDYGGRVRAMDAATGAQRFEGVLPGLPGHFAGLAYGGGQVYAATSAGVAAFQLIGLNAGG
jgi:outer membrane protein assembly factor BamB